MTFLQWGIFAACMGVAFVLLCAGIGLLVLLHDHLVGDDR